MEIDHFEDLDTDGSINVKIILKEIVWEGPGLDLSSLL